MTIWLSDERSGLSRRGFLRTSAVGAAGMLTVGCLKSPTEGSIEGSSRLIARPSAPTGELDPGTYELYPDTGVIGNLFIPESYTGEPVPLLIMLHGAGASRDQMHLFFPRAAPFGVAMLTPKALRNTWDMMFGGFGPDIERLNRALAYTFESCRIDPDRIALGGFSDGGSYALSVGLGNGDLFSHVVAFSPGFMEPEQRVGRPSFFVTHGTQDTVLPIDSTSRQIVPQLRSWGYDVDYSEFDGPHTVTQAGADAAFGWMTG